MAESQQKLGQYQLLEKIAQGGMAQVYKAKTVDQAGFEKLVVIKRILPHIAEDPEYIEMLVDEAKIAVNFNHGNIAQIYDLGRVGDDYFIVMEYADGKTFSQIKKRLLSLDKQFPIDILLYCMIEVCHALSYIHNKRDSSGRPLGVVHRDVSPQNVILTYAGTVKLIDFGVAKARYKEGQTEHGVLKGKFAYMSPEQSKAHGVDHRSDVFSMGTLLWEMVTGERLFKRKTNQETIKAIQKGKFEPASKLRKQLTRDFDKIIRKALQLKPKNRYQDASEMAFELEKLLFKVNPDFKPVYASEFVYKLFGPDDEEVDLPNHIFVKEETPHTKVKDKPIEDEVTEKEDLPDAPTPIVNLKRKKKWANPYTWGVAAIILLFLVGMSYVYSVNKFSRSYLVLEGITDDMHILLNEERVLNMEDPILLQSQKEYKLIISQKGYQTLQKSFVLNSGETKTLTVKMKKRKPLFGSLLVTSTPAGATVYIDNRQIKNKTPTEIPLLRYNKTYKLGLFLEGYQYFNQNVRLFHGQNNELEHQFEVNYAKLIVSSQPSGLEVWVGDDLVGRTPYKNLKIKPGEELFLTFQDPSDLYYPQNMTLKLAPGEEKLLNIVLDPVNRGSES